MKPSLKFQVASDAIGLTTNLLLFTISGIIGALCFPYAINTWLVYAGKAPVFLWWWGFLLGYVPGAGQLALPVAAITFILMLFM
jgi:hypothetical protein